MTNGNLQANSWKQMRGIWCGNRFQRIVNLIESKSQCGPIHLWHIWRQSSYWTYQCQSLKSTASWILKLEMFYQIWCRHPLMYFYIVVPVTILLVRYRGINFTIIRNFKIFPTLFIFPTFRCVSAFELVLMGTWIIDDAFTELPKWIYEREKWLYGNLFTDLKKWMDGNLSKQFWKNYAAGCWTQVRVGPK